MYIFVSLHPLRPHLHQEKRLKLTLVATRGNVRKYVSSLQRGAARAAIAATTLAQH